MSCALCIFARGSGALAKGQGVEVVAASPKLLQTAPGRVLSLSFRVTSAAPEAEEFVETVEAPEGWPPLLPSTTFPLAPGEVTARLLAITVPLRAAAGRYTVTYAVRSRRGSVVQDTEGITVVVLPVTRLALVVDESPSFVIAGEHYEARLRVSNRGNAPIRVKLQATVEGGYRARVRPTEAALAAGGSQPLRLVVETPPEEPRSGKRPVQVEAQVEGGRGEESAVSLGLAVEVVARVTRAAAPRQLPAAFVFRASGGRGATATQIEFRGRGYLDEGQTRHVDFLLRGPDTQASGAFGQRDEWRLNYGAADLQVRLGDQSYSLSRLTESYRYGRGLALDLRQPEAIDFGAFLVRSRWDVLQQEDMGAYLSHSFGGVATLRANVARLTRPDETRAGTLRNRLWSLESVLTPSPNTRVQLEYGRGGDEVAEPSEDRAYRVEAQHTVGKAALSLTRIHADPDYGGYYSDCDYSSWQAALPVADSVQVHAFRGEWAQNLDLRPERDSAPRERLDQVGVDWSLRRNWYLSLDREEFHRQDLLAGSVKTQERVTRVSVGRSLPKLNVHLDWRTGEREEGPDGASSSVQQYLLFASYRPAPGRTFTLYTGGGSGLLGSRLLSFGGNRGGSAAWQVNRRFSLTLFYLASRPTERFGSDQGELAAVYLMPDGGSWTARLRRSELGLQPRKDTSFLIERSFPFALSLGDARLGARVEGRVYDAEMPDHRGLPNVIVIANEATAVTGSDGSFVFPNLPPGAYALRLDPRSIDPRRLPEHPSPVRTEAVAKQTARVEIGVVTTGSVIGTVTVRPAQTPAASEGKAAAYLIGPPQTRAATEVRGLDGVLLELTNGTETLTAVTFGGGKYRFDGVRPGPWRLRVSEQTLPAFHYLETAELAFDLRPGEDKLLPLTVAPRVRPVKMLGAGEEQVIR